MPYISKEDVATIRTELKKAFPEFKLSVVNRHHSEVNVTILEGPIDFGDGYIQVNHYHIDREWASKPECMKVLEQIISIIEKNKKTETLVVDSDYGNVPNYYTHINIGAWNKPYQVRE